MEILGLKGSAISSDGKHIKIMFETDIQPEWEVEVNGSLLDALISQLAATLERSRELQGGAYVPMFAEPAGYIVKSSSARRAVTMGFRMANGLNHNLIFSIPDAERLHTRIGEELDLLSKA